VGSSLRALRSAEFIQEESLYPVAEYRFWHPLTQEVAYGSLLGERRSRIHAAVAGAIAELEPERADERAALLAQHWEAAGRALEAAQWNARAALQAALKDFGEAQRRWQSTVRLLADVPESDETLELGVTARQRLTRIAFRLGADPAESEALADEARVLAERRGDPVGLAMAIYAKGFLLFGLGRLDPAVDLLREALRLGEEIGSREIGTANTILAYSLSARGPLPLGLAHADKAVEVAQGDLELGADLFGASMVNYSLFHRAWLLARMGHLEDAARAADQAIAAGRERSEPDLIAFALPVHALIGFLSGDGEVAIGRAMEAVRFAGELGNPFHTVLAQEGLGAAYLAAGRGEDALPPLRDALALARDRHVGLFEESCLLAYLADAQLHVGDETAALQAAEDAVAVAQAQAARVHECQALVTRARMLRSVVGPDAGKAIAADLAAADAAIEEVGAYAWAPFADEERVRLARLES
jgi:adenylate cyclase